MYKTRYLGVLLCSGILFFSSCKNSKEYNVDSAFADYLQRFENEGASRGHMFNPQATGLIIEFGNLSNNDAGLTHYETPIRIQIDKTYWDALAGTAGEDLMKEDLIFHELGHGLLGRDHINTTLANGDWKSIMCGGTMVNNRAWNINYRGIRRKYYIDELFDQSTPAPDFASLQLPVDTTGYGSYMALNFDTPAQAGWKVGDSTNYAISLDPISGRLSFRSKVTSAYLVFIRLPAPITVQTNFSYELTLNYPGTDATGQYGLAFGPVAAGTSATTDPVEYFTVNNNQNMYMGNRSWYSFFTELTEASILPGGNNKLKVFNIGQVLYYFINGVYCYNSEMVATDNLNEFGFVVPPMGTVWLDNLQISKKGASNVVSKVKQNLQFEFRMQPIDKFGQNKIKNQ